LIVFFALVSSLGSGKDVWSCVSFPRYMVNDEVVFLQVCMPLGHMPIKIFRGFPILEVHVVGEDNEREFGPS
jgi:hypothetical protein